ncbi:MAG: NUDIX hydrolase [Thermoleophilia bacterium]|nr:NUDIX hydrolase [Thermoleophilia bacterium]
MFRGYRHVVARRFELPDGTEADFEVLVNPPTVAVLALTRADDVVLVREFRPGPERVLLELPGGIVDEGEEPLDAARRELVEETGYDGNVRLVGAYSASAYSTHRKHTVVAIDCRRVADPAADEHVDVVVLPLAEFREHLRHGDLTDVAAGYQGLDALNRL